MEIYRGEIELLDYVFYATVERGKVYETGAFLHNYALTYALGLVRGETYTYARLVQQPYYAEELTPLNGRIYITPGEAVHVSHRLVQWNTLRETYAFPGKPPSLGYPDWGFARVLRPGSRFRCYVLVNEKAELPSEASLTGLLNGQAVRIRLGKFPGKARLRLKKADKVTQEQDDFQSELLLNWRDLGNDPVFCDVLAASLPTRLISRARFAATDHYIAHFGEEKVCLPAAMAFLAREVQTKRSRRRR
ncbi:type I-D CRISPR-associated protein Cas5/Csc1 [Litorilinea aerophila]|nr:type I-D CRISPR-associated protein Cas5/Csc1 [Litorilinea aerophila]MCC9078142.1 type I-D CRISPR-associated protein Cas5/Csc1 [Litorilinea aerophila]OUC09389.1 hypothetical protein RY27_03150 [Litorilinea aerophila]